MFIFDDLVLGSMLLLIIMLVSLVTPALLVFASILIGVSSRDVVGGVKKLKKIEKDIDILLKTNKYQNKTYNVIDLIAEMYGSKKQSNEYINNQTRLIDLAKKIYKDENVNSDLLDIDYEKLVNAYNNPSTKVSSKIDTKIITKHMNYRLLSEDYYMTNNTAWANWGMKYIEYIPINKSAYDMALDTIYKYAVLSSIRELTTDEYTDLLHNIDLFQSGQLTKEKMIVHFFDKPQQSINHCNVYQFKMPYSDVYKKLHWGQRKLLLSEIDFFNRVAIDMGPEKFKKNKISLVYAGAAHGHHLLIELEMYTNLILYLWDPARYNAILYIADFIRRKMDIPKSYTDIQIATAKKYVNRVFINMELTNAEYLTYWTNSNNNNVPKNYITQHGYFTEKSAKYYLKYKQKVKDTSPTLFVSDIRLYTKADAINAISFNAIKDYSNSIALLTISEKIRYDDLVRDMKLQQDWLEYVNADYGLLKFKLKSKSYSNKQDMQYEYLDGDIILQAWAPITSTESRLFVRKSRKQVYYNIKKYTDMIKSFNIDMRVHDMSQTKLTYINVDLDATLHDIWRYFLTDDLICQDTVLETKILYDYLCIYKDINNISPTDLILLISDITQSCLDPFDQKNILGYLNNSNFDNIMNSRLAYHNSFCKRLDYNSPITDRTLCQIKRPKPII